MNEWIRTKDTLPDAGVPVLVYSFPTIEIATIYKANNDEKVWWLRNVGIMDLRNYKWWMPLPEPPKEPKKRIKDHVCNNDYCELK